MSQRGGYPDEWSRQSLGRSAAVPTSTAESREFPRSPAHLDNLAFLPTSPRGLRTDRYGSTSGPNPLLQTMYTYSGGAPAIFGNSPYDVREVRSSQGVHTTTHPIRSRSGEYQRDASMQFPDQRHVKGSQSFGVIGSSVASASDKAHFDFEARLRSSPDQYPWEEDSPSSWTGSEFPAEGSSKGLSSGQKLQGKVHSQRRPSNRDEFDGPHQFLDRPSVGTVAAQDQDLPHLPTNLYVNEQDEILSQVNDRLSKCAFDFVARYQFPIPLEPDKRPVRIPGDREWTEWVYLLKRLATKRRVPARVLYHGQIKQLVTVLENSLEMRHAAKHQSRPLKDDRNVLQLISAGIQVARILKDASAMQFLDDLYMQTEKKIQLRKSVPGYLAQMPVSS